MKKVLIALIAIMTISLSGCASIKEKVSDIFWGAISAQFERELDEKTKNHGRYGYEFNFPWKLG